MANIRRLTAGFRARGVLQALREDKTVQAIATRHQLHPNHVSQWTRKVHEGLEEEFVGPGRGPAHSREGDSVAAREDRAAGGGAGFLGSSARVPSRSRRGELVRHGHPQANLSPQRGLLGLSRSWLYPSGTGPGRSNLALMRRIDEL